MDIATAIGLIAGIAVITLAVATGSDLTIFLNLPGLMIVLGGTFAATLIKFPLKRCFSAFGLAIRTAFSDTLEQPKDLIRQANELAAIVRKRNIIALDDEPIKNKFFKKGIQLCVDGHPPQFIHKVLTREMNQSVERHDLGERIFRAIGESAPAFGMIGTLIGLVQMLSNMQDPSKIGPGMAIALLTTLYGALIGNLLALPLADKLQIRSAQERTIKSLIIESVLSIQQGQNPRVMDELLEAYVPTHQRQGLLTVAGEGGTRKTTPGNAQAKG